MSDDHQGKSLAKQLALIRCLVVRSLQSLPCVEPGISSEQSRNNDGSDGCPARSDADDKRAFPTEVGSQDRKARGEHEPQAEAHADALSEEDLPVRLGERKGKDAGEPADGPDRELVPEPALVEEDAGVEGRRECKEEVAVGKESGRRSPNFVRGVTHRLPIQEMSELV